jgi:DNA-binding NtrC family response regulator
MEPQKQVLIASSNLEMHKRLTLIFSPWHLDLLSCCSLKVAQEILARQPVFLAFCEDRLPDGNYHELLAPQIYLNPISRIVVFFRTPNDYEMRAAAAIQRGAYATLGPFSHDIEVEGVLIRAIRDNPRSTRERLIEPLLRPVVEPNAVGKQSLKMF